MLRGIVGGLVVFVAVGATTALVHGQEPPQPTLSTVPGPGGLAIAIWSGGSVDDLAAAAAEQGCGLESVSANRSRGSGIVLYVVGAPPLVNGAFLGEYPDGFAPQAAVVVRCSETPVAPTPTATPTPTPEPPADDHADGKDGATALELGQAVVGECSYENDSDWFRFHVNQGRAYAAEISEFPPFVFYRADEEGFDISEALGSFGFMIWDEDGETELWRLLYVVPWKSSVTGTVYVEVVCTSYPTRVDPLIGPYRFTLR
jgi:hypothetical protein